MRRRNMKGSYFRIGEGELPLPEVGLLMLDEDYYVACSKADAEGILTLLPPQRFGPPELCFPDCESDAPAAWSGAHGKGQAIYVPWHADALYYRDSLPDTRVFMTDLVLRHIDPVPARVEGRGSLELTVQHQQATGNTLIHLINYGGQRNNLYEDAPAIHGLRLGVQKIGQMGRALVSGQVLASDGPPDPQGYTWFTLPPIEAFEAIEFPQH